MHCQYYCWQVQMFQSYQSKQINPDKKKIAINDNNEKKFQSYQSKQINPDPILLFLNILLL